MNVRSWMIVKLRYIEIIGKIEKLQYHNLISQIFRVGQICIDVGDIHIFVVNKKGRAIADSAIN